jgi:hypothetical protein
MAKTMLAPELQALLDREAIRDLPLRYCDRVWQNDIAGLVKLFAREGEFAMVVEGKTTSAVGHANLRKIYRQGLAIGPRPFIHNHVIEVVAPDRATGRCYLDLRSIKQQMEFIGAGYYNDDYVKLRGEWKFARRVFTALRFDGPALQAPH